MRTGKAKAVRRPVRPAKGVRMVDDLSMASSNGPIITADTPPDQYDPLTRAYHILATKGGAL